MMTKIHGMVDMDITWCGRTKEHAIVTYDPFDAIIDCKTCLKVIASCRSVWPALISMSLGGTNLVRYTP
jgi:hypothetical protein